MAIKAGYYMMLHKANEAVARAGFDAETHHGTMIGLRGMYDTGELATDLNTGRERRNNVDYHMDPSNTSMDERAEAESFINEIAEPFVDAVDELIDSDEYP